MTREEKINWAKNASNEELFEQLQESTVLASHEVTESFAERREHRADANICKAELMARLSR